MKTYVTLIANGPAWRNLLGFWDNKRRIQLKYVFRLNIALKLGRKILSAL